ncbi:MAG: GNAT family N-acetyltransferase [Chloroflexi bacterium]|nr:GNAT family N-acetyltransferase [Chloroflexota bacterium]
MPLLRTPRPWLRRPQAGSAGESSAPVPAGQVATSLVGESTRLRPLRSSEIPILLSWMRDPQVGYYLGRLPFPIPWDVEARWLEESLADPRVQLFAIETREGRLIGNIGLHHLDPAAAQGELSIVIGEVDHWDRGYGSDAIRSLLRYAFESLNLERVHLRVYEFNQRAVRCYEKCGFQREGTTRAALYRDGRFYDEVSMAIQKRQFLAQEQSG